LVRRSEKKILNDTNKSIRFPIGAFCIIVRRLCVDKFSFPIRFVCDYVEGKVQTPLDKALIMTQATLGGQSFESFSMKSEIQARQS
jgi:hypothetical protein